MESRTLNTKKNIKFGLISKALLLIAAFISRTLFIRILGAEYVGISSLYSNILGLLNLADLGMLNVLAYELYKALKEDDYVLICSLVDEFRKIYLVIIIVILSIGIAIIPALKFIVNSSLDDTNLIIYYVLYLFDSVASYFVVYRTTVITADQKAYIPNLVQMIGKFAMYCIQTIYLFITKDFTGYLVIQVISTIITNLILHKIATKMYPYLNEKKYIDKNLVDHKRIYKNIKATFISKISNTILSQTDNIIISIMFGTLFVGYYANYNSLNIYACSIFVIVIDSITASLGNLIAENNSNKSAKMFFNLSYVFSIINTLFSVYLLCLTQDFIPIWIGKDYLMGINMVIAIVFVFYQGNSSNVVNMYRSTLGIFHEVQYMYLLSAVLNIVLSIFMGKLIGVPGVIYATGISRMLTTFWYDGLWVMKKLKLPIFSYFKIQIENYSISILIFITAYFVCDYLAISGIIAIVIKMIICTAVTLFTEWLFLRNKAEYSWIKNQIKIKLQSK